MKEQRKVREMPSSGMPIGPASAGYYYALAAPLQDPDTEAPAVPFSHYLWILRRHVWKMAAFVAACLLITFIVSSRLQAVYQSTATVDIEHQAPSQVVGQSSAQSDAMDSDAFIATQIKLIQSDAVLRPVAEQFHLFNFGHSSNKQSRNEQAIAAAPVTLSALSVTRPTGTNLLLITYRSPDPRLSADVANAVAKSYLAHTYELRIASSADLSSFMGKQIDALRAKMERSNLALAQFDKTLDVVNPDAKANILSARLLQLNTEYATAQADRINKQAAWDTIKSGSLAAEQISSQGSALGSLSNDLRQAQQHFALIKTTYGPTHPAYQKAASQLAEAQTQFEAARQDILGRVAAQYREALNREQMLDKAVTETKAEWDQLNARSFEYQQLKQEADADKSLYDELIRKIREADINSGFQNNNISIADYARPALHPVSPNIQKNLLLALLASLVLAIGVVILHDSLDTTLRDPVEAGRFLGTDVIGWLPIDRNAAQLPRPAIATTPAALTPRPVPSSNGKQYYRATSPFEEAVRSLRNTVLLSDFEGRLRSILFTSAAPTEGKSTLAAHFAVANADRGKKTLLVDADLRRPSIHSKFALHPREGLSNVLTGELLWQDAVLAIEGEPNLHILPSGPGSHRAADLIGPRLSTLLDDFAKEYDLVILDSPPLPGFAECLQMATAADGVIIVSHAGSTKRKAVAAVISTLNRIRANIVGVVLNQVSKDTSADGYAYYGYNHYDDYHKVAE